MSVSTSHLNWVLNKAPGREHVLLPNFVRHFNLYDKASAEEQFLRIVNLPHIGKRRRCTISNAFEEFQAHRQDEFWANRNLELKTAVSALQAGIIAHDMGIKQAKIRNRWNRRPTMRTKGKKMDGHTIIEPDPPGLPAYSVDDSTAEKHGKQTCGRHVVFELHDFLNVSPCDLGPVAFFKQYTPAKSSRMRDHWNLSYISLFTQALSSQEPEIYGAGQEMRRRWDADRSEVSKYWEENEPEDTNNQSESMEGVKHRKRPVRHLNDDVEDQEPSGQANKAQKLNLRLISMLNVPETSGKNNGSTFLLIGPDLPSESSGSSFVGSIPISNRSSLQPIDFRFENRLLGPGTTSSRLTTNDLLRVGTVDISSALMSARKYNVAHQSELESISDLLTLNFIFDEAFLAAHLTPTAVGAIVTIDAPFPDDAEGITLIKAAVFVACKNYLASKAFIRALPAGTIVQGILTEMVSTADLFMPKSVLKTNEDSYIQHSVRAILVGVFGDLEFISHWTRDPLPTPNGYEEVYEPDFFAERDGFPFILVEVKKPHADASILDQDARKLPHMMKLALDRMVLAGIKDPFVIGLLIQDGSCHVKVLSLPCEAIYLLQEIGSYEIPENKAQLGLLLPGIGPLTCAKDIATRTLESILCRPKVPPKEFHHWTRTSFYLQSIKVPAPLPPAVGFDM